MKVVSYMDYKEIIKWLILIYISSKSASYIYKILESTIINIWISRLICCAVAGIVSVILYKYWIMIV